MKKVIGNPTQINENLIFQIKKVRFNNYYIKNHEDFRDKILKEIKLDDEVLDIGMAMRDKHKDIKSKLLEPTTPRN